MPTAPAWPMTSAPSPVSKALSPIELVDGVECAVIDLESMQLPAHIMCGGVGECDESVSAALSVPMVTIDNGIADLVSTWMSASGSTDATWILSSVLVAPKIIERGAGRPQIYEDCAAALVKQRDGGDAPV